MIPHVLEMEQGKKTSDNERLYPPTHRDARREKGEEKREGRNEMRMRDWEGGNKTEN